MNIIYLDILGWILNYVTWLANWASRTWLFLQHGQLLASIYITSSNSSPPLLLLIPFRIPSCFANRKSWTIWLGFSRFILFNPPVFSMSSHIVRGLRAVSSPLHVVRGARALNLHEYQSKELMQKFDVSIQKFKAANTAAEAEAAAKQLSLFSFIVVFRVIISIVISMVNSSLLSSSSVALPMQYARSGRWFPF